MTPHDDLRWRRDLARRLTERARASSAEILDESIAFGGGAAHRVGITGPPGVGKSSLIAMLARHWMQPARRVGVIAIDPTSPLSGGSLLGDRIRMDTIAEDPRLFIRSVSSGSERDGLCGNISSLLDAFEQAEFAYLILETVGVGQVSYAARPLVDTFVLVLAPESGDAVQAMKAGILEVADIYVVNKADHPAAAKLAVELSSVASWRAQRSGSTAPVVLTSSVDDRGAAELAAAIDAHRAAEVSPERRQQLIDSRREFHLRSVFLRRIEEMFDAHRAELRDAPTRDSFDLILKRLCRSHR